MTPQTKAALELLRAHHGDLHHVGTVRSEALATRLDDAVDVLEAGLKERAALLEALMAVENKVAKGFTFCAMCEFVQAAGHRLDCIVGKTLADIPTGQEPAP